MILPMQTMSDDEWASAEADLVNGVYRAAIKIFEGLEHKRVLHGNGHHMAQHVAQNAREYFQLRRDSSKALAKGETERLAGGNQVRT